MKIREISGMEGNSRRVKRVLYLLPDQMRTLPDGKESEWLERAVIAPLSIILFIIVMLLHVLFWALLFILYPFVPVVRSVFFWNAKVRRIIGCGYMGFLITHIPFLRSLLVRPYRKALLAVVDASGYYDESRFDRVRVRIVKTGEIEPITLAIPKVKQRIALQGTAESEKTAFLMYCGVSSPKPSAYMDLSRDGSDIHAVISSRFPNGKTNYTFIQKLLEKGAVTLLIDNLDSLPPESSESVRHFLENEFRGNVLAGVADAGTLHSDTWETFVTVPAGQRQ